MKDIAKILYVKDFGAVGDGVNDDAYAINMAIEALKSAPEGSTLVFESNKTYYYRDNHIGQRPVFFFRYQKNKTLKGDNSMILLGGTGLYYADIEYCENITIEGFNFDYGDYKPAFHASFESIDTENGTAIMFADRDIHLKNGEIYDKTKARGLFACIKHPKARWHMYVDSYEMLDEETRKFKVTFSNQDKRTMDRLKLDFLKDQGLVMMMPYTGNIIERAFSVHNDTNFTVRNVNIYSASRHGFSLQYNFGNFLFENVNYVRNPEDMDLWFTSWGDTYHLLQNRAKYVWKNCKNEWNYDDVFNISVSRLVPKKVFAKDEADLFFLETKGEFAPILVGDTATVVNRVTGQYLRTEIKEVICQKGTTNHVKFKDEIDWLEENDEIAVYIDPLSAAGSVMENCDFDGTMRARNDITFINTRFYVRRFWVGNETVWEGSLPKNIVFENCKFEYDDFNEPYWHIVACTRGGDAHAENIVFKNCEGARLDLMEHAPNDELIFC